MAIEGSEQPYSRGRPATAEEARALGAHHEIVKGEPVRFAAGPGFLYPEGTEGYDRLLNHARGLHGTGPGTAPDPDCEACQRVARL